MICSKFKLTRKRIDVNNATNFSFDFGIKELSNMVGLSPSDGALIGKKLLENRAFQIMNDKIFVKDVREIARQNGYFRKMQQLEKSRMEKKGMV